MHQPTEPSDALPTASETDGADAMAVAALDLARHFARGATLWCASPRWPEHARHVAVEFVHPVIVGKRALPAISVESPGLVASLRAQVRSDDVLVLISDGEDGIARDVLRRSRAWGATSIWIGAGNRPAETPADHVIWTVSADGASSSAAHDGQLVLSYHVLWELTHVCFEHPGLLSITHEDARADEVCVTCSDEGLLGEVLYTDADDVARVRTARGVQRVDTTIVAPVAPGDIVLVHAGAAIAAVP